MRVIGVAVASIVFVAVAAGCSPEPPVGTIAGHLLGAGATRGTTTPVPGTLTLTDAGGDTTEIQVGADGTYATTAQVGEYKIVGRSPDFTADGIEGDCYTAGQQAVSLLADSTTTADVYCLR